MVCVLIPDDMPPGKRLELLNALADESVTDPEVQTLSAKLWELAGRDQTRYAQLALYAAQQLPYVADPPGTDVFCNAGRTIVRGGDCDKKVVVLLALARSRGVQGRPVWMLQPWSNMDHVSAELKTAGRLEWADATLPGAALGEHPYLALMRLGTPNADKLGFRPGGALTADASTHCVALRGLPSGSNAWQQCTNIASGFVQIMLPNYADGWLDEAVRRTGPREFERLERESFQVQRAAVIEAWRALSWFFLACNLPPLSCPVFREVFDQTFGNGASTGVFASDPPAVGPFGPANGPRIQASGNVRGWMFQRARDQWQTMGKDMARVPSSFVVRTLINNKGRLVTSYAGDPFAPNTPQGSDWRPGPFAYVGCAYFGQQRQECNPYNWNVCNWHDPIQGTNATPWPWEFLAPLKWWLEYAGNLARALRAIGDARAIVRTSREWVTLTNASEAARVGLLGGADELAAAALRVTANARDYAQHGPEITAQRTALSSTLGLAAAGAALIPGVGWIASGILGLGAALSQLMPGAVGIPADRFGFVQTSADTSTPRDSRGNPVPGAVFLGAWIAGDSEHAPSYVVPAPPGVDLEQPPDAPPPATRPGLDLNWAFFQGGESATPPNVTNADGTVNTDGGTAKEQTITTTTTPAAGGGTTSVTTVEGWSTGEKVAAAGVLVSVLALLASLAKRRQ
jgi:hypothetical protein